MIPTQYAFLFIGLGSGLLIGAVVAIIFKPWYDKKAEEVENLTAEEAQSLSDIFGSIAKRLKTPGK